MSIRLIFSAAILFGWVAASASEQDVRNQIGLGALVFSDNCIKCHQLDGYGQEKLYPSLRDPKLLADKERLIRAILHGRLAVGEVAESEGARLMPRLDFLTNEEIVAIVAFITNSWGDEVIVVSEQDVQNAR